MRFAKECRPFVLPVAALGALLAFLGRPGWGAGIALLAFLVLWFFRIPRCRDLPQSDRVLAPANGRIVAIDVVQAADVGLGRFHRVATFLSLFDVHVQRAPVDGEVVASEYSPGRKLAAFRRRAGEVNEQQLTVLRRPNGDLVGIRQIAGLLARRVVTYLQPGFRLRQGDLMGVIKFGSRVDLLVPESYHLEVAVGQRVREGRTAVARILEAP